MNKHIVITIRYSLYAPEMRKSWVIGRDSEEDYKRELFSSERMSKRQSFFEKITLKSLIELNKNKPENVTLKVFLLTSNLLPKQNIVENAIKESFENSSIFFFIKKTLPYYINFLQDIRNEVVHGSIASKDEANTLRNKILGVADDSILTDILKYKKKILESRT